MRRRGEGKALRRRSCHLSLPASRYWYNGNCPRKRQTCREAGAQSHGPLRRGGSRAAERKSPVSASCSAYAQSETFRFGKSGTHPSGFAVQPVTGITFVNATNDAPAATRLNGMGAEPCLTTSTVDCVIARGLARSPRERCERFVQTGARDPEGTESPFRARPVGPMGRRQRAR